MTDILIGPEPLLDPVEQAAAAMASGLEDNYNRYLDNVEEGLDDHFWAYFTKGNPVHDRALKIFRDEVGLHHFIDADQVITPEGIDMLVIESEVDVTYTTREDPFVKFVKPSPPAASV